MPELTHDSVQQLLDVLDRAYRNQAHGIPLPTAYHNAVRDVSNRYNVTYQTIGDLCRRRLGLDEIREFIDLLARWFRGETDPIRRRIKRQSPSTTYAMIDAFFASDKSVNRTIMSPGRTAGSFDHSLPRAASGNALKDLRIRIKPELVRRLQLAQMAGIAPTLEDAAVILLEKGFETEKARIKQLLDTTFDAT